MKSSRRSAMRGMGGMGYSVGFLRGILAIAIAVCAGGLLAGAANEIFGFGWWEDGYPPVLTGGRDGGPGSDLGYGGFAIRLGALIAAALALSVLLDRFEPKQPPKR